MSLTSRLRNDPRALFARYSFVGTDAPSGMSLDGPGRTALGGGLFEAKIDGDTAQINHVRVGGSNPVSFVKPEERLSFGRGKSLFMHAASGHPGGPWTPASEWTPAYFLPWDQRGAIVGFSIPRRDPGEPLHQYPELFMTAALSGCSIFVNGPEDNPNIYHCGIGLGKLAQPDSEMVWRAAVDAAGQDFEGTGRWAHAQDYMRPVRGPLGSGDAHATGFREKLEKHYHLNFRAGVRIEGVEPWGGVFGVRAAGQSTWTFYLQENATITYVTPTGRGQVEKHVVSRPMVVRELFPNPTAGDSAVLVRKWKSLKV